MINYELAKKLKEAGFDQKLDFLLSAEEVNPRTAIYRFDHRTFDLSLLGYPKSEPDYYTQGKWRASCIFSKEYLESEEGKEETLLFPTLSELIEAVREIDYEIQLRGIKRSGFIASCMGVETAGSTPEEAVANLWLKINEN